MFIRPALPSDRAAIWRVISPVIRAGETYTLDRDMSEAEALNYWFGVNHTPFVAKVDGQVMGTYYIRPNQLGGGRHICNCGYMVDHTSTGKGIARAMCAHSLEYAKQQGYRGMQFNFVVSSNTGAVALWESMGFGVLGRLPGAFEHPTLGYVDALIMFKALTTA